MLEVLGTSSVLILVLAALRPRRECSRRALPQRMSVAIPKLVRYSGEVGSVGGVVSTGE